MTTFIAIVQADNEGGYAALFPDFPGCSASASTLDEVIKKAREVLLQHIEGLVETGKTIRVPTPMEAIQRGDASLLAAIEVPDDLGIEHVDIAIPALSLARIESFAGRYGLSLATLFVKAVDRWAMQETVSREIGAGVSDGPTLFDFGSPLELRVEAVAAEFSPAGQPQADDDSEAVDSRDKADGITAELARLLGDRSSDHG